ncbi:hypothetical protein PSTG_03884 [Puccinia striiformis f. sp. tritici PST-78]|uniref:Uncharacterized protein n=1 Tax=Puccinia striiformis f. sp. tritici PST-78 TaxID=1165861 RepID=A0A0L0VVA5_9BASI|nr:hypothetical protein PSTG_03884 [Puccinia striiformis f. sp. tritici PST-78]
MSLPPSLPPESPPEVVKWELPTDFESFRTFIDHGCTLDPQNYPLYPNGDIVFVKIPKETVTNFGSVGFTKATGTENRSKGIWKINRIYCLGALVCDVESCMWIGSPPTARNAVEAHLESDPKCKGAAGRCPGKHAWPEAKKPDKLARETLKAEIVKNPSAGALKLKMGPVTSLEDPITNLNIVPDKMGGGVGDKFTMDMFQWNRLHVGFQCSGRGSEVSVRNTTRYTSCSFQLLRQVVQPEITLVEQDLMARQVVDFSLTQVEGFKDALREVFDIHDPIKLDSMVKGCHQHFRAQVGKIGRQCLIIPPNQEKSFEFKCMSLLDLAVEGGLDHEGKLDELHRLFPRAKRWLDWWTMSGIQSMLFPSRHPMLDDSPDGIDGLPNTTIAIKSMHRVYYMISSGNKCLMVGMVELYSYVNVLEEEFNTVMCGVSVEYGSQTKMQVNVSQSIGWTKPTKRKYVNDGRPPDTTVGLLDGPDPVGRKKNLGRPKHSQNVDRNPYSTYQSYCRSEEEHLTNQCWMSAAMKSLFALYNPLWLRNATGKGATLFHHLVSHFGSRTTFNLTKKGRIKTILTNGQSKLFKICNEKHQANFVPGHFASCDFFLELLLDPKRNPTKALSGLFELVEHRTFSCSSAPPTSPCVPPKTRNVTTIAIHKRIFDDHQLGYGQVQDLIELWSSTGITNTPGLTCKCQPSPVENTAPKAKAKKGCQRHEAPELLPSLTIVPVPKDVELDVELVSKNSRLAFKDDLPPQHLYFFNEVTSIEDLAKRTCYMGALNWPARLVVAAYSYTLFSRGFWANRHYWCKVIHAGEGGATGVWLHDDMHNAGNACLVNKETLAIGGCRAGTSWLFYLRSWTPSKEQYVRDSISKISKDNPTAKGDTPFLHLGSLINCTPVTSEQNPKKKASQPLHRLK